MQNNINDIDEIVLKVLNDKPKINNTKELVEYMGFTNGGNQRTINKSVIKLRNKGYIKNNIYIID